MKKWLKWMLVLCMVLGFTMTVHAEDDEREGIETPVFYTQQTNRAIVLTWDFVDGADEYHIFRKEGAESSWDYSKPFFKTKNFYYINDSIEYGKRYYYKVQAVNTVTGEKSERTASKYRTVKVASVEKLKTHKDSYNSVRLTWQKSHPATGYEIYRGYSENGTYYKIATIKNADTTEYIDNKGGDGLKYGVRYYYKMRAVYGSTKGTLCGRVNRTVALDPPEMVGEAISVSGDTIKVKWEQSKGAQGYYVLRRPAGGEWKQIKTITGGSVTEYEDKADKSTSKVYEYCVRSWRKINGKRERSYRSDAISARILKAPENFKVAKTSSGVKLTWEKSSYATGYRVYKKVGSSGEWGCIDTLGKDATTYTASVSGSSTTYWKVRPIYTKDEAVTYGPYTEELTVK